MSVLWTRGQPSAQVDAWFKYLWLCSSPLASSVNPSQPHLPPSIPPEPHRSQREQNHLGLWSTPNYTHPLPLLPPMSLMPQQEGEQMNWSHHCAQEGTRTASQGMVPGISGEFDGQTSYIGILESRKVRNKRCTHFRKLYNDLWDCLPEELHTRTMVAWM